MPGWNHCLLPANIQYCAWAVQGEVGLDHDVAGVADIGVQVRIQGEHDRRDHTALAY